MNIFFLSRDNRECVQWMVDKHVIKQICESTQMLANCYTREQLEIAPKTQLGNVRKYSHFNHPSSIWCRKTIGNFNWLLEHASCLVEEKKYRYGGGHFCEGFINWAKLNSPDLTIEDMTEPALAMPDEFRIASDPVMCYRQYYKYGKKHLHSWSKRSVPFWI